MDQVSAALGAVLICAAIGALLGFLTPLLIRVVPEPAGDLPADKESHPELAARHGLGLRTGLAGLLVGAGFGWSQGWSQGWYLPLIYLLPLIPVGIALAVIDWRTGFLPKWPIYLSYPFVVAVVLGISLARGDWSDARRALIGWAVVGGFYLLTWLLSPRMVAYGDVRLAGLLGIGLGFLGWGELVIGSYAAFLLAAVPALALAVARRDRSVLKARNPFGPAMLVSAALGVVFGAQIASWYLATSGY